MPETMSIERRKVLKALGANLILTEGASGMKGSIAHAEQLVATDPDRYILLQQFKNPANPEIHFKTTGPEIWNDTEGGIDVLVSGVGTGGTISGVGEALREELGPVSRGGPRIVAVEPDACATISRGERGPTKIQGLAAGFVPVNYHPDVVDEVLTVTDADAWKAKVHLARRGGLLVGISAGAAACAAHRVAAELGPGKNVVTVMCDTGERYFSLGEFFPEEEAAP